MSKLVIYGGAGALGRALVQHFKTKGYTVISVDLVENQDADFNTLATGSGSLSEQGQSISESIASVLGSEKLCGVFCVAGGWAGGNAASKDFLKNSELMLSQSVNSSLIAAHIASKYLQP
ncbi:Hsp90 cochaperone [Mucor velutinosus]|uniref:Hsp90 cochaperone n=1 Tax=Mucor velutinosus TaxID=708070 RepID=A0AAN7DDB4_9FUNG|nr:Hsp90 cochaperone [Mucor velutinosus]